MLLAILRLINLLPAPIRRALRRSPLYGLYQRNANALGRESGTGIYPILGGPLAGLGIDTDPARIRAYILGEYEPAITTSLQALCRPGMVVADIGAHHGYFSLLMAGLVGPEGMCVSFEASRANADRIARSIEHNKVANLRLERTAVSDIDGSISFGLHDQLQDMGRIRALIPDEDRATFSKEETVPAVSMDGYWADHGLQRLDVAKIDVEGAELAVIRGMRSLLATARPTLIIEVHHFVPAEDCAIPLMQTLAAAGYRLRRLADGGPIDPRLPFAGHLVAQPEAASFTDALLPVREAAAERPVIRT